MISREKVLHFMEQAEKLMRKRSASGRTSSKRSGRAEAGTALFSELTDTELADITALIDYGRMHYHTGSAVLDRADLFRRVSAAESDPDRQVRTAATLRLLQDGVDVPSYLRCVLPLLDESRAG
jgi:hypothetical protein